MSAHDAFSMDNARRQELMALLQQICPGNTVRGDADTGESGVDPRVERPPETP